MECKTAQQMIMPYIQHELDDRQMEEFIEHIRECKTCSEELEVYFTIYYALEKLDDQEQDSFDIKKLLEKNLEQSENKIARRHIVGFYRKLFAGIAAFLLAIVLFTGIQIAWSGSFEKTTIYQLFEHQEDTAAVTRKETEEQADDRQSELETNRKRQVIVTTPETEDWIRETAAIQ